MTDPSTPDTRLAGRTVRRRLATLAAAAITGAAFAPALAVSAAGADPESACGTFTFGADASADLLRLRTLDLNPLAVPEFKPVSEITIASTAASSTGGAEGRSDARAKYLAGSYWASTCRPGRWPPKRTRSRRRSWPTG
jgi:hypothetical protein